MDSKLPLVSVCVQTYQHVNYIVECIESIINQKTTFPFEVLIGEDASTDGTREICMDYAKRYPSLIRLGLRDRKNVIKMNGIETGRYNFMENLKSARGKYIAILDGDDFWTDEERLQKQIEFLESKRNFSICWTKYKILQNDTITIPTWDDIIKDPYYEVTIDNFSSPYCTQTLTCVFRKEHFSYDDIRNYKFFKDNTLYLKCLQQGRGAVLNCFGGIYRIHSRGIYSWASDYQQAISNFTNYTELLLKIPQCRVPNIYRKHQNWKTVFFRCLNQLSIPKYQKWLIRLRLNLTFLKIKYL